MYGSLFEEGRRLIEDRGGEMRHDYFGATGLDKCVVVKGANSVVNGNEGSDKQWQARKTKGRKKAVWRRKAGSQQWGWSK